jgi:haloalkane dehalogenase
MTLDIRAFRHLYPFRSHFMKIGGLRYHYLDEGEGDPVVMLHGNPTWSFYYRELAAALASTYRVVVPDHMGCGLSDKPDDTDYDYTLRQRVDDLGALLDHLDLRERLTLVVHDWGGMIGMAYAAAHPERVGRLVITNTAAFFPPGEKGLPLRLRLVRDLPFLAAPAVLGLNLFARAALYMAVRKPLPPAVKKGLVAPYDRPRNRIATLRFVQDIPVAPSDPAYDTVQETSERLHRLSGIPVLILWGMHDFVFDGDYLAEWERRFPGAEVHRFSDAGHYLMEDAGDRVIPLVQDFLQTHPI